MSYEVKQFNSILEGLAKTDIVGSRTAVEGERAAVVYYLKPLARDFIESTDFLKLYKDEPTE